MAKITHPFHHVLTTRFKFRLVESLLEGAPKGAILDVGCGAGYLLYRLQNKFQSLSGVDMSQVSLDLGKKFSKAQLQAANAEQLPFNDETFDCVVSTDAFEHIPDDLAAAKQVFRVLKKNGRFVIYVPTQSGLLSTSRWVDLFHTDQTSYLLDQRYYTTETLTKLVKDAGFEVEEWGYHNIFLQELFTQVLKFIAHKAGKQYAHQADIHTFTKSRFFGFYKWVVFPIIFGMIRVEEFIFENIFRARVPGHRLFMKCRKKVG